MAFHLSIAEERCQPSQRGQEQLYLELTISDTVAGVILSQPGTGKGAGFLYSGGVMTYLVPIPDNESNAGPINNAKQVIVQELNRSYIYHDGIFKDIGDLGGGVTNAFAINEKGLVVGELSNGNSYHAFLFDGMNMIDLGTFSDAFSRNRPSGINSSGQVVGHL